MKSRELGAHYVQRSDRSTCYVRSKRPFSEVVKAFEHNVGTLEEAGWFSIPASSKDAAEFEDRVKQTLGTSGFTRFLTDWGLPASAVFRDTM